MERNLESLSVDSFTNLSISMTNSEIKACSFLAFGANIFSFKKSSDEMFSNP